MQLPDTPSAHEFNGYYNVPSDESTDDRETLNTFPNPPPLTLAEVKWVSAAAYRVIHRSANRQHFTDEEVRNYYDLCISEHLTDRTLVVGFLRPQDCTVELVRQLGEMLRADHNLWRAMIAGDSPETTIVIYPNAVRYGLFPVDVNDEAALAEIIARKIRQRKIPLEPTRQQVAIRQAIQRAVAVATPQTVRALVGFDNYNGDPAYATLWVLCEHQVAHLQLLAPAGAMVGDKFRAKADGDFGYHVSPESPFWIREWIFPRNMPLSVLQFTAYDAQYTSYPLSISAEPIA